MHHSSSVVYLVYILFAYQCAAEVASPDGKTNSFVTQTVYGFLDFTTTIGKTVMIFSPQSAPTLDISQVPKKVVEIIQTKPYSTDKGKSTEIYPTKLSPSTTQNKKSSTPTTPTTPSTTETARKEYVNQPDYDLLSRQPEAFAEESYHVHDLVSKKKSTSRRNSAPKDPHPVGLVTTLSGKIAMDGTTTIHETSVIGTYISGKYAQVLQSNSHILSPTATSTARILRTESPNLQRPRFKNRASLEERRVTSTSTVEPTTQYSTRKHGSGSKNKAKSRPKNKTSKVLRSSQRESRESSEFSPSASVSHDSRKYAFRQRLQAVLNTTSAAPSTSNVKLRPVGRWQYKSTLKPRVYIRKASDFSSGITPTHSFSSTINDIELNTINSAATEVTAQITNAKTEKSLNVTAEEQIMLYPVETINVDIVTPSNFEDVYYEVATIKTPYTFQMGNVKKTRYVTVTSTTEKVLESEFADKSSIKGPLIENILAPTTQINQQLQASTVQTFSPCTLIDPAETPSLDEFIETYTQSQMKLKTQVFPLIGANQSTSYLTLLQTYAVTTVITATKTTPVCIGNNFNEFNTKLDESGSELHLELEFGDVANLEPENSSGSVEASRVTAVPDDLLKKPSSDEQLQGYYPQLSPEQYQQLAYLKLLQQNAQVPQIVAPPPEIQSSIEPLYESHIIPLIHGTQTSYKTLSKLITRTEQRPEPSTYIPQPLPSLNPFGLPQQQQQFKIITSPIVQPTVLTQTHSRILKLTFGAKTALTTIYSTNILSTAISTYVTTSFPVQATPSFNNFFPPVFPQYPFLG